MSTANLPREDQKKTNFELELDRVREKIKARFIEFIDYFKARESEMLRELDNIQASYLIHRNELEKINEKKTALEEMENALKGVVNISPVKDMLDNMLLQISTELNRTKTPIGPNMVSVECDRNKMLAELNNLFKLVDKVSEIDYKRKHFPLVSVCAKGNGIGQLNHPRGITVDNETGNIYIVDQFNNCVNVFNRSGEYLFKFGDKGLQGKLYTPLSLAIYENRIIILESSNCILNYQLDGKFISKTSINGLGRFKFAWPNGIAINDSDGYIYVTDCVNNRIQVFSPEFGLKFLFGQRTLKFPRDVKLTKEYIYVLDQSNPCLHLFNYNLILLRSVISRGDGMQVICPFYFFIDPRDNIIISDRDSNSIHIFSTAFQLVHKIPVSPNPMGITVDFRGRVIVACRADNSCLQIL